MKKHIGFLIVSLVLTNLCAGVAWAFDTNKETAPLDRDITYEQNLRWEAGPDKTITPAKVLRWMTSLRGQTPSAPSNTEFVPIVNVHDSRVRIIAAIAYKF